MNILILLIGLSAIMSEKPSLEEAYAHLDAVQKVPLFLDNDVKNNNETNLDKKFYIAEDFIPIVLIAESVDLSQAYIHYLPIYNLHRKKEFFLLI